MLYLRSLTGDEGLELNLCLQSPSGDEDLELNLCLRSPTSDEDLKKILTFNFALNYVGATRALFKNLKR